MLETARVAQMRLRFSRRLRRALLARGRVVPPARELQAGDLAFFYRKQMKSRKEDGTKGKKTKLVLNKWHGPAMVLGHGGNNATYLAYRGGGTKCAPEHVRLATHTEQFTATEWAEHLADAVQDLSTGDVSYPQSDVRGDHEGAPRVPERLDKPPALAATSSGDNPLRSDSGGMEPEARQKWIEDMARRRGGAAPAVARHLATGTSAPATPSGRRPGPRALSPPRAPLTPAAPMYRADRSRSPVQRSLTPARVTGDAVPDAVPDADVERRLVWHDATTELTAPPPATRRRVEQDRSALVVNMLANANEDPKPPEDSLVMKIWAEAQEQRARGVLVAPDLPDHGTWRGSWSLPARIDVERSDTCGRPRDCATSVSTLLLPTGTVELDFEAMAATARKEITWRKMVLGDQKAFQEAGEKHWQLWLDHNAVQLLTAEESRAVEAELGKRGLPTSSYSHVGSSRTRATASGRSRTRYRSCLGRDSSSLGTRTPPFGPESFAATPLRGCGAVRISSAALWPPRTGASLPRTSEPRS